MKMFQFDSSRASIIRLLEAKEKHAHFSIPRHWKGGSSYLTCTGDTCPVCSYVKKLLTPKVRLILFWHDICTAFKRLFSKTGQI